MEGWIETLKPFGKFAWDVAFVFGCFVAYTPQYIEIMRTKNTEGFSLNVSLLFVIGCTLRIVRMMNLFTVLFL